jgi:hypothetical protein
MHGLPADFATARADSTSDVHAPMTAPFPMMFMLCLLVCGYVFPVLTLCVFRYMALRGSVACESPLQKLDDGLQVLHVRQAPRLHPELAALDCGALQRRKDFILAHQRGDRGLSVAMRCCHSCTAFLKPAPVHCKKTGRGFRPPGRKSLPPGDLAPRDFFRAVCADAAHLLVGQPIGENTRVEYLHVMRKTVAELAQAEQSDVVAAAYVGEKLAFGPEYLIPKPFDPRLITRIAPAVARGQWTP